MHHPLGKEFFQAHVIIQNHLQKGALGRGGETKGYPRKMVESWEAGLIPAFFGSASPSGATAANLEALVVAEDPSEGGGCPPSPLTLMGPSRMICPSLAMLSYSWMAARR